MSFVDLLFPQKELEALGNKWHEPAPKRRKLNLGVGAAPVPRHNSESSIDQTRPRTLSSSQHGKPPSIRAKAQIGVKRSNSACAPSTKTVTTKPGKSCLPTFIEPSILKNYLHHLHPNDRSRYSLASIAQVESDDAASSPGSLTTDSSSPANSTDHGLPPSPGIFEQLRAGPFGPVMYGLRITDHERDMMEDLLSPAPLMDFDPNPAAGTKWKDVDLIDEDRTVFDLDPDQLSTVHSSGLSITGPGEESEKTPGGIVMPQGSPLSMDDFFDLDEAAIAPSPLAI